MSTITSVSTRVIRSTALAAPDAPAQLAGELHRVADVIPILPGADEPIGPQRLQHFSARPGLILRRRRAGGASRDDRLHGLELSKLLFDPQTMGPLLLGGILIDPRAAAATGHCYLRVGRRF